MRIKKLKQFFGILVVPVALALFLAACGSSSLSGTYQSSGSGGYVTFDGKNITIFTGLSTFVGTYKVEEGEIVVTFGNGEVEAFSFQEIDRNTIKFDGSTLYKEVPKDSANIIAMLGGEQLDAEVSLESNEEENKIEDIPFTGELLGIFEGRYSTLIFYKGNKVTKEFFNPLYSYEIEDGQILLTNQNPMDINYLKTEAFSFRAIDEDTVELNKYILKKNKEKTQSLPEEKYGFGYYMKEIGVESLVSDIIFDKKYHEGKWTVYMNRRILDEEDLEYTYELVGNQIILLEPMNETSQAFLDDGTIKTDGIKIIDEHTIEFQGILMYRFD